MSEQPSRAGRRLADDPIAIIGLSGLFPLARDHREYWQNIVDGADCTTEVPESRWRQADYYDPDPAAPDKSYSRRGAFIPDVELDPLEFGMPPSQLDVTSTMQTLSLGVARDVLRDAGAEGSGWYDRARTGVVLGVTGPVPLMHPLASRLSTPVLLEVLRAAGLTESDAQQIADRYVRAFARWEENSFPGFLPNVVAGRVANRLDLGGLNSTVDAACAASLSALRMAIAELTDRRADTMITGGVDTENTIFLYLSFSKVGALSKTDRISPFSDQADGTLLGEGMGMLALRRLADAERDGNRIYAVIRGLGSSSDGRANSIYAPRAEGQRIALQRAYQDADCSPASVELFEAHATGTAVGDRTELIALRDLLAGQSTERHFAALGSVKSQIGHTKGAAGTASLIKAALSLYHKTLPPTINVERPNSQIDFASAPFYVNVKTRPWIRDPQRPVRRAAVSAMGFGGTNFHVVLEEHDRERSTVRNLHRTARAHVWHAADPAALADLLRSAAPAADGGPVPGDHARIGFVATDEQTADRLRVLAIERIAAAPDAEQWTHPNGVHYRRRARADLKIGALFAGQGSQYVDMGLDAVLNVPTVAAAFDEANASFATEETRLAKIVFPPPLFEPELRQAQESMLHRTEYAQPAIGALSAGQFRFLREVGLQCSGFLGHSFGELTALWAAGSLTDADYFRLAAARGAAMAPPPAAGDPGAMAAVTASKEQVAEILKDSSGVVVCNHNAPDQVVIGGGTAAVEAVVSACAQRGYRARVLPVSAAFHTEHVGHATAVFREAVGSVRISGPGAPVYANSPGASYGDDPGSNAETLTAQLLRPVEFVEAIRAMRDDGVTVFVEFGPKQVLTSLVRRIAEGTDVVAIATDAGPIGDADVALKHAAVQLVVLGAPLRRINRHDEPEPARAEPAGMTITLSAPEYIPPERRAAYQEGLTDGFRVTVPAGTAALIPPDSRDEPAADPPAHDTSTQYAEEELPMPTNPAVPWPTDGDPATQHIALHSRYLDSQLQVAEALMGLVAEHGLDNPRLPQVAEFIKEQSIAISQAHAKAAEVLARLTELELGATPVDFPPAGPLVAAAAVPSSEAPDGQYTIEQHPALPALAATPVVEQNGATAAAAPPVIPAAPIALAEATAPAVAAAGPAAANGTPASGDSPATGADAEMLRTALIEVVAGKTGYPPDLVDPGMDLEAELGVDSIKRVQVIGAVQEQFPGLPAIGPEQLSELRTLNQMVGFMTGGAGGDDPKAPSPATELRSAAGPEPVPRYRIELVDLPAIDELADPFPGDPVAVLADHGSSDAAAIAAAMGKQGWTVRRVALPTAGSWTDNPAALEQVLAEAMASPVHAVLAVLADAVEPGWAGAQHQLAEIVLLAKHAQAPLAAEGGRRTAFITVTRLDGSLGFSGAAAPEAALIGGVAGVVKTLAIEAPGLFCRALDIHPDIDRDTAAAILMAEMRDAAIDTLEVGVDAALARRTVTPSRYHLGPAAASVVGMSAVPEPAVQMDDVFVVTGGARGITASCIAELATFRAAEFILLGRTELAREPEWASTVADADLKAAVIAAARRDGNRPALREIEQRYAELAAQREIRATLARLEAAGATASYLPVDVTDAGAVRVGLAGRRVTGVIHGAGVLADAALADKTSDQIARVFGAKLTGLETVLDAVEPTDLRHLVLFTSVAGLLGNAGQADYAAANEALCRFAASWRTRHPGQHVAAINWGAWDGGMVTPDLRATLQGRGVRLLDPAVGVRAFTEQLSVAHQAETCVLIGETSGLSAAPPARLGSLAARRDLTAVETDEVIRAHRIGAHEVLPATFGLGWLINVAERAYPGTVAVRAREFQVLKGIVFDGDPAGARWVELGDGREADGGVIVRATAREVAAGGPDVPLYGAIVELTGRPGPAAHLPGKGGTGAGAGDALPIYTSATLFHGPRLQGMRDILEFTEEKLVVRCRLADAAVAGDAFAGALHRPVLTDVLLQASSVLGGRLLGQACLPLEIATADYYGPLPDDEDFIVVCDQPRAGPAGATVTVTAIDGSGQLLTRFGGTTVVPTPGMAAKFAEAAEYWLPELERT